MLLNPHWIFVRVHGYAWAQFLSCSNAMQTSSQKGSSCSLKKKSFAGTPVKLTSSVLIQLSLLMYSVTFKWIILDRHSCSSSFHTMFCTPDKGSGIETSLGRIACTVRSNHLTETQGNNFDNRMWQVSYVFASRRVALCYSMRRSGRYNTWLNTLERMYSGTIQGRWEQGEVLGQAWDSILEMGLGEEVDCNKSENMQGST